MLGNDFRYPSFLFLVQPQIVEYPANNISNKRPLAFSKTYATFLHPCLQRGSSDLHEMVTLPVIQINPHRHLRFASDFLTQRHVLNLRSTPHKLMLLKFLHPLPKPLNVPSRPPDFLQERLTGRHIPTKPQRPSGPLKPLFGLHSLQLLLSRNLRHSIGRTVKPARLSALSGIVAATFAGLFAGGGAFLLFHVVLSGAFLYPWGC